tara:strand:- start:2826 stop:3380 length:555 start_codon:yes stop_codon:yes gene_type:complete
VNGKKERLRKKFFSIRKKNYFEIKVGFFKPLIKLIKKKFRNKNINLSLYYPSFFEANVLKLFENENIKFLNTSLPIISNNKSMQFYKWRRHDILQVNKYGLLEPLKTQKKTPDIMLIPLLAFDSDNNRLGYGGGYYDRYLNKYLKDRQNILTIGIAFSFQKFNKLPITNKDMKLNYILTEKGIF